MKIKTSDLIGPALDWAVHVALHGKHDASNPEHVAHFKNLRTGNLMFRQAHYSTSWVHGGPIIEREGISLWLKLNVKYTESGEEVVTHLGWQAGSQYLPQECRHRFSEPGPTPLVAAMRCYVASKLGDEVEIPDGLEP